MEELLNFLIINGKAWVKAQRELHRASAEHLRQEVKGHLASYFHPGTLESVRFRQVECIENPDFYEVFEKAGQPIPLDFRAMEGITFIDTIVIAGSRTVSRDWTSLLFHECVHAVQYQVLGLDRFIEEYVRGWAQNGFDYFSIPLERQAYDLQRVFETDKQQSFSVEIAVKMGLEESTVIV